LLERAGYTVIAVQNPLTGFDADVATTRRAIDASPPPVSQPARPVRRRRAGGRDARDAATQKPIHGRRSRPRPRAAALIAVGRPHVAEPDLVARLRDQRALTPGDPATYYAPGPTGLATLHHVSGRAEIAGQPAYHHPSDGRHRTMHFSDMVVVITAPRGLGTAFTRRFLPRALACARPTRRPRRWSGSRRAWRAQRAHDRRGRHHERDGLQAAARTACATSGRGGRRREQRRLVPFREFEDISAHEWDRSSASLTGPFLVCRRSCRS
jgi:hypothetical protein